MLFQKTRRVLIHFLPMLLIALAGFMITTVSAQAQNIEHLYLTGVVKDVDYELNQVVIDVSTLGCKGTKTFLGNNLNKYKLATGQKVDFYINSEHCPAREVGMIVDLWRAGR